MCATVIIMATTTNPFLKLPEKSEREKNYSNHPRVRHYNNACIQRHNKILRCCCRSASSFIQLQICDLCYLTPRLLNSKMTEDASRIERNLCAPVFSDCVSVFHARFFCFIFFVFFGKLTAEGDEDSEKMQAECILWR